MTQQVAESSSRCRCRRCPRGRRTAEEGRGSKSDAGSGSRRHRPRGSAGQSWQEEVRRLRRENARSESPTRRSASSRQPRGTRTRPRPRKRSGQRRSAAGPPLDSRTAYELAGAEVRASLASALSEEQITDLVEDLNLSRFVTDDGDVDREAVKHFRDKTVSILGKKTTPRPGHGQRQGAPSQKSQRGPVR